MKYTHLFTTNWGPNPLKLKYVALSLRICGKDKILRTLILNAGFEPLLLVSWKRAICLVLSEKAEVVKEHEEHLIRTVNEALPMPSIVRLNRYVKMLRRFGEAKCSRKNLMIRDNSHCQYCNIRCSSQTASVDHIVPRSKGGLMTWDNVVIACHTCNRKKGDKDLHHSGLTLIRKPYTPNCADLMHEEEKFLDLLDNL